MLPSLRVDSEINGLRERAAGATVRSPDAGNKDGNPGWCGRGKRVAMGVGGGEMERRCNARGAEGLDYVNRVASCRYIVKRDEGAGRTTRRKMHR